MAVTDRSWDFPAVHYSPSERQLLTASLPSAPIECEMRSFNRTSESATLAIYPLSDEEEVFRKEALTLAAQYLDSTGRLSMENLQELHQVVAQHHRNSDTAQIAVGIAFGEAIAEKAGWEWVMVTDEYGAEISLSLTGYAITCHPTSMIRKRIDDEEPVDLADLRDKTFDLIERCVAEGHVGLRKT